MADDPDVADDGTAGAGCGQGRVGAFRLPLEPVHVHAVGCAHDGQRGMKGADAFLEHAGSGEGPCAEAEQALFPRVKTGRRAAPRERSGVVQAVVEHGAEIARFEDRPPEGMLDEGRDRSVRGEAAEDRAPQEQAVDRDRERVEQGGRGLVDRHGERAADDLEARGVPGGGPGAGPPRRPARGPPPGEDLQGGHAGAGRAPRARSGAGTPRPVATPPARPPAPRRGRALRARGTTRRASAGAGAGHRTGSGRRGRCAGGRRSPRRLRVAGSSGAGRRAQVARAPRRVRALERLAEAAVELRRGEGQRQRAQLLPGRSARARTPRWPRPAPRPSACRRARPRGRAPRRPPPRAPAPRGSRRGPRSRARRRGRRRSPACRSPGPRPG